MPSSPEVIHTYLLDYSPTFSIILTINKRRKTQRTSRFFPGRGTFIDTRPRERIRRGRRPPPPFPSSGCGWCLSGGQITLGWISVFVSSCVKPKFEILVFFCTDRVLRGFGRWKCTWETSLLLCTWFVLIITPVIISLTSQTVFAVFIIIHSLLSIFLHSLLSLISSHPFFFLLGLSLLLPWTSCVQ